jgi:hypothetical protein
MMRLLKVLIHTLVFFYIACTEAAGLGDTAQGVDFLQPKNGDMLESPFEVKFLVTGMEVSQAGDLTANTGHHHLLINSKSIEAGKVVPADERHVHFGKGQTETTVNLPSGRYTLTLQFANGLHESYGEVMSKTIEVTVK